MRLTIHRSDVVLEKRNYQIRFDEYAFRPLGYEDRRVLGGPEGWLHYRMPSQPVAVEVPARCRVVSFAAVDRLETDFEHKGLKPGDIYGLDAEAVVGLARRGDRGFSMAEGN